MTFCTLADGTRVRYEVAGPTTGGPVLFLCGISVPLDTFERNFGALAEGGLRVYRFDYPGRGFSDRPRSRRYDLGDFVDAALAFLDAVGESRRVGLVGLSMGGAVAATLVQRRPDRFGAVALIDPLFFTLKPSWGRRALTLRPWGDVLYHFSGRRLLSASQAHDFFDPRAAQDFVPFYEAPFSRPGLARAILATWRSVESWTVTPAFVDLGLGGRRILLVWGTEDRTIPFSLAAELRALVGEVEFIPVERAGHVPHWEHPEVVNPALLAFFLDQVAGDVVVGGHPS